MIGQNTIEILSLKLSCMPWYEEEGLQYDICE